MVRTLDALVVSSLCRAEVPAALWRKHRIGELDAEDTAVLVAAFEADYHGSDDEAPRFAVVATTDGILRQAARLVAVHPLRAYDAVQLSSALSARHADPECTLFACFDDELTSAAIAEGFEASSQT